MVGSSEDALLPWMALVLPCAVAEGRQASAHE